MRYFLLFCAVAAIFVSGCAKQHSSDSGAAAPVPSGSAAATSAAASSPPAATLAPSPSASATVTATPEPNLLSWRSGTIVRRYPANTTDPDQVPEDGIDPHNDGGPWSYVFELPGTAKLTRVSAKVSPTAENGQSATVSFAASTTGPDAGFSDIATINSSSTGDVQSAAVNASARWVRVTISRKGDARPVSAIAAYGEIGDVPGSTTIGGTYVQYENPYDTSGKFRSEPDRSDPWYLKVVTIGTGGINGEQCFDGHLGDSYPGTRNGRLWTWTARDHTGTFVANDEGSILVGTDGSGSFWVRTDKHPKYCEPQTTGSGPVNVLVLDSSGSLPLYPATSEAEAKTAPRFRFTHIGAATVDQQILKSASTVILNGVCDADDVIASAQDKMLIDWVASGHKLLIYDADMCHEPTHYAMLPYQFQSNNPGARGAKGDRLIQVEDDTLGTSDRTDKAHYFDPKIYAADNNQLGDANTVTTHDPHWCGHLFGTNSNHVNGFMQMYSNYGKGVIVYDGFDHDDGDVDSYRRIRLLELDQPIPADLPCTQQASLGFVIEPNRAGTFVPGKAVTLTFPMELLANQGWKGHVTIAASGDFKGSVTPNSFDVDGGTKPLKIAVSVPADAKAGTYNVVVTGSGGNNQTAQAAIQLTAAVPIVKQFQQRRIRIYGIHFDVDKSTIKPQSEPVIAQIAAVMKQNLSWRFRIEGHTDSDGGYAHNMLLSRTRAQSVVNDLVNRYHIARSRLAAAGYGYSRPVASNATAAGKALNRRVELVRL